jgi:hypothetical protein
MGENFEKGHQKLEKASPVVTIAPCKIVMARTF